MPDLSIQIHTRRPKSIRKQPLNMRALLSPFIVLVLSLGMAGVVSGSTFTPLSPSGYRDFSYGPVAMKHITGEKPESKLWWNDGHWWGSLLDPADNQYHIQRFDWATQTWVSTGAKLDDRNNTKADTLWDQASGKLYVTSHLTNSNGAELSTCDTGKCGRLFRYSYNATANTYALDTGYPIDINQAIAETLPIDKDARGRLWTTFVARDPHTADYQVYVSYSKADPGAPDPDASWLPAPIALESVLPPESKSSAHVLQDDIAAVIAFQDDRGPEIGVVWSNQNDRTLNFATHNVNDDPQTGWTNTTIPGINPSSDDHISLRAYQTASSGAVFGVTKADQATNPEDPLVVMFARDGGGNFSTHAFSTVADNDTRPILLIDQGDPSDPYDDKIHVFATGKPDGSKICYKSLAITYPLSSMGDFSPGNCGASFMEDAALTTINDSTSTKQNVNIDTGVLVLASTYSCDTSVPANCSGWYVHNVLDTPPAVKSISPAHFATNVDPMQIVTVTFNKQVDPATVNSSTFTLEYNGKPVSGHVDYNPITRTAAFTPDAPLAQAGSYKATITGAITDLHGNVLSGGSRSWYFTAAQILDPVPVLYLPLVVIH